MYLAQKQGVAMNDKRPSVYLEEKCQCLEKVLDFFLSPKGSFHKPVNEKLLVFLYQLDFWDWEMANLLFSFDNFDERSKAWIENRGMSEYILHHFSILVKQGKWEEYDRSLDRDIRNYTEKPVVAPWELLRNVIEKWNLLLNQCEERIMQSEETMQNAIKLGAQILPNLNKYKKELPCPCTATNSKTSLTS